MLDESEDRYLGDANALFPNANPYNNLFLPKAMAGQRDMVFRLLGQAGALTPEALYDGAGDEGCIADITARSPGGVTSPLD